MVEDLVPAMSALSSTSKTVLQCGPRMLGFDRPRIMGILNVTPDSFSDGGQFSTFDDALRQVERMLAEGADLIDIGGESTRPGADPVSVQEELDRVIPIVEAVAARFDTIISIDTSKALVMTAAAGAGAGLINDVWALQREGALAAAADTGLPVCLMHMQGQPTMMQSDPSYHDVVTDVIEFLEQRRDEAVNVGILREQILLDPGFGFGKTFAHNIALLRGLPRLVASGPVLTGLSRKRMLAEMLDDHESDRTVASVMAAMRCIEQGATIVRVHDVRQMADAIKVWLATR